MFDTPGEHRIKVLPVHPELGPLTVQVHGLCIGHLLVHRRRIVVSGMCSQIEEQRTPFDGHLCLAGKHGMFVRVPSVTGSIKLVTKSMTNARGTEARNGNRLVCVARRARDVPVHLEGHQIFTARQMVGSLVQQGQIVVSACFGYRFQSGLRPRQIRLSPLDIARFKTDKATLHPQATLEGEVACVGVPNHVQRVLNGIVKANIPQPSSANKTQDGLFPWREVHIDDIQQFGSIEEHGGLCEGEPRWPTHLFLPGGQHVAADRPFFAPS